MISRRRLLIAAGSVPAATLLRAPAAEANPILLTDPTQRAHGPVGYIGDSQSGGYPGGLRQGLVKYGVGPFRCDIQGSRSLTRSSSRFPSGVQAVHSARAAGFDPPVWVLGMGANDMWFISAKPSTARQMIDQLLGAIGGQRTVYFLTMWELTQGTTFLKFNAALNEARGRWPRLHLADWASIARRHPEWHGHDGVHYTATGAVQRNAFIVATMKGAS